MHPDDQHLVQDVVREWLGFGEEPRLEDLTPSDRAFVEFSASADRLLEERNPDPQNLFDFPVEFVQYDKFRPGVSGRLRA
ncbi:MAG: hypothetical protein SF028_10630 [Candidatus Sumerlaeia bacterium]|nr:hypothetical protein [Candidatus Sumerlaeia bacterium]